MDQGQRVSVLNLNSVAEMVPTFGYWCGPEWSAGQRGSSFDLKFTTVAKVPDQNGRLVNSQLDALCQVHDRSYIDAFGKPDAARLKTAADIKFLNDLGDVYDSLTPVEKPYALLAYAGFVAKFILVDIPSLVAETIGEMWSEAMEFLRENSTPTPLFVELDRNSEVHSILLDSEGNVVLGRSKDDESTSITIDPDRREIEFLQRGSIERGEAREKIQIRMDLDSSVSELTHSSDGAEDLKGVIVGPLTQEKLDQFSELGSLALDLPALPDAGPAVPGTAEAAMHELFGVLDVPLEFNQIDDFSLWFDETNPILIEPYQWDSIDAALENFWYHGTDQTLAAYDLGNVIEEVDWRPDFWSDDWSQPDLDPWYSGNEQSPDYYFPEPVYYSDSQDPSGFGDGFFGDPALTSGSGSGGADPFHSFIDPLVLKLGKGAVHTTNRSGSSVRFDMDGDGHKEKTGWITADHAFLVRDKNKNGKVDGISEMFSEKTSPTASTGFGALAELDTQPNGRIDKYDKQFSELRLWTDINANGVTDSSELHKLSKFGIKSIDLGSIVLRNQYDNGNMVLGTASYTSDRNGVVYTGEVAEVLFNFGEHAPVANVYLSDQATAVRTADGKVIEVLSDAGAQKVNASLSGVNVLIGEAGDVLNAGNAGQSLLIGNGGAILNGNGGAVHFIVNGSLNIVNTGMGTSVIDVHGDGNTINAAKGEVVLDVDGSRNMISIGSNAEVDLGGTANMLTAAAKSEDNEIEVTGKGHVVNASDASIAVNPHTVVTLNGKDNDITMEGDATLAGKATGGTLIVTGDDNVASLTGAFVGVSDGELTLTGLKHQVVLAGEASVVMTSSAKTSIINVFGKDNELTANKATIYVAKGAELDLAGTGDKVTLTGNDTLDADGSAHVIDVYGSRNKVQIDLSTVYERGLADLTLSGAGNTLKVTKDNSAEVPWEQIILGHAERTLQEAWSKYEQAAGTGFDAAGNVQAGSTVVVELTGVNAASAGLLAPVV